MPICPPSAAAFSISASAASFATGSRPTSSVPFGRATITNPSAFNRGMMGYQTPNIDRVAKEGGLFTDWYGQQSCTAGRACFITGQSPFRTGLLKVGLPGAKEGLSEKDRLEGAGIALHRRARHFFLDLAAQDPERYLVLDARATRDELAGAIAARVGALLGFA